jgi:hypothetical protein
MDVKARAREHLEKHRDIYIGIGIGAALVGITWVIVKDRKISLPSGETPSLPSGDGSGFFFFGNGTVNFGELTTNIYEGKRGHHGFLTRCLETGEVFKTQSSAARAFGTSNSLMSTHLNGSLCDIHGFHFERVVPA